MLKVFSIAILLYSSLALAAAEEKDFDATGLTGLKVNSSAGDVRVRVSKDGRAYVTAKKVKFDKNCKIVTERRGKELYVGVEREGLLSFNTCQVNFEINVPRKMALNVTSGAGDLSVIGTHGDVNFELGSGDVVVNATANKIMGKSGSGSVDLSGTIGSTQITTGSGSIKASGLSGDAVLKTGSGDLKLTYDSAPSRGKVEIATGSGDATLYLPSEVKAQTSFKSGSGRYYNEIGNSAGAPFKVSVKTGSGDLEIKKR